MLSSTQGALNDASVEAGGPRAQELQLLQDEVDFDTWQSYLALVLDNDIHYVCIHTTHSILNILCGTVHAHYASQHIAKLSVNGLWVIRRTE